MNSLNCELCTDINCLAVHNSTPPQNFKGPKIKFKNCPAASSALHCPPVMTPVATGHLKCESSEKTPATLRNFPRLRVLHCVPRFPVCWISVSEFLTPARRSPLQPLWRVLFSPRCFSSAELTACWHCALFPQCLVFHKLNWKPVQSRTLCLRPFPCNSVIITRPCAAACHTFLSPFPSSSRPSQILVKSRALRFAHFQLH